jgi:hypothetical protein
VSSKNGDVLESDVDAADIEGHAYPANDETRGADASDVSDGCWARCDFLDARPKLFNPFGNVVITCKCDG